MYGNPDLKPETSRSQEVAVYWQHPRGHNFNATYFYNTFDEVDQLVREVRKLAARRR